MKASRIVLVVAIAAMFAQTIQPCWSQQKVKTSAPQQGLMSRVLSHMRSAIKRHRGKRTQATETASEPRFAKLKIANHSGTEALLSTALVKCTPDTDLIIKNERTLRFTTGEVLIAARYPVAVFNNGNKVTIGRHAIVSVKAQDGILVVRNLSETKQNTVNLESAGRHFELAAGSELLWASDSIRLANYAQSDYVNRRMPNIYDLPNGNQILASEFSTVSAIKTSPILRPMAHSKSPSDKVVFNTVMKMAACLALATRSHGQYAPVVKETSSHDTAVSYRPLQ